MKCRQSQTPSEFALFCGWDGRRCCCRSGGRLSLTLESRPKLHQVYDYAVGLVVSTETAAVVLPTVFALLEYLDALHHIVHLESVKLEEAYQKIGG